MELAGLKVGGHRKEAALDRKHVLSDEVQNELVWCVQRGANKSLSQGPTLGHWSVGCREHRVFTARGHITFRALELKATQMRRHLIFTRNSRAASVNILTSASSNARPRALSVIW